MFGIVLVGIGFAAEFDVKTEVGLILGVLAAALAILVSLTVAALTRCPRCSTRLGRAGARVMWIDPANNYSTCGVSFDEPMPLRRSVP
jgi:hypothetical protein